MVFRNTHVPPRKDRIGGPNPSRPPRRPRTIAVDPRLGAATRRIRKSQGLALVDLAASAGISRAMLSRLETGHVAPSLETLVALADALGVKPALLLEDLDAENEDAQLVPSGQGLEVVRHGTRPGCTYRLLAAPRGPHKLFEPFLITFADRSEVLPGIRHPGTEFIYVLDGSMTYRHGSQSYRMRAGDSLTFRGDISHGPESLGEVPVRMLSIIVYQRNASLPRSSGNTYSADSVTYKKGRPP